MGNNRWALKGRAIDGGKWRGGGDTLGVRRWEKKKKLQDDKLSNEIGESLHDEAGTFRRFGLIW